MPEFPQAISKGKHRVTVHAPTQGKERYRLDYRVEGKRHQPSFPSYAEAKKEADRILIQLSRQNPGGAALNRSEVDLFQRFKSAAQQRGTRLESVIADWTMAVDLLGNPRLLVESAQRFTDNRTSIKRIAVSDAVTEYLSEKQTSLSSRTFEQESQRLNRFTKAFECNIDHLGREGLRDWIDSLRIKGSQKHVTPKTRNHFRASVRTLLKWCVDHDYLSEDHRLNAALKAEKHYNDQPIAIYSPEEFARLLQNSKGTLKVTIAIAGLCGLRTAEMLRLDREDVLPQHIQVGKDKAKTRQRRLVPICKSLATILKRFPRSSGRIWQSTKSTFYREMKQLHQETGVEKRDNALRHSFCSYRLAITRDELRTSQEAGHDPSMLYRNYRELVTESEAQRWFDTNTRQSK
jgi:integrase